jgi:hypothetical protein
MTRFLLGLAGFLGLLLLVGGLWWGIPSKPRAALQASGGDCKRLMVSADGKSLLVAQRGRLTLWNLERLRVAGSTPFHWVDNGLGLEQIWLSADGQKVAFLDERDDPGRVLLWNRLVNKDPVLLPDCWNIVDCNPDSPTLITRGKGGYQLWDVAAGKQRPMPAGLGEKVRAVQQLRDGRILAAEGVIEEGWLTRQIWLRIWDLTSGSVMQVYPDVQQPAMVSANGHLLAAWSGDYGMLFDLKTGRAVHSLRPIDQPTHTRLAEFFSPTGTRLATLLTYRSGGSRMWDFEVWDVNSFPPKRLGTLAYRPSPTPGFSPDGQWLGFWSERAPDSGDWQYEIWDPASSQLLGRISESVRVRPTFAPGSTSIVALVSIPENPGLLDRLLQRRTGSLPINSVKVWTVPDCREIASFPRAECFAYFPDGQQLAVARGDTIELWDIPPRRPLLVEYGLPVLFVLVLLLGVRHCVRFRKKLAEPSAEPVAAA